MLHLFDWVIIEIICYFEIIKKEVYKNTLKFKLIFIRTIKIFYKNDKKILFKL